MELFWLNDQQWSAIKPHLPHRNGGARRADDRRVISGIVYVIDSGCAWVECPREYGPPTTLYNRWRRWQQRQIWQHISDEMQNGDEGPEEVTFIAETLKEPPERKRGRRPGRRPH